MASIRCGAIGSGRESERSCVSEPHGERPELFRAMLGGVSDEMQANTALGDKTSADPNGELYSAGPEKGAARLTTRGGLSSLCYREAGHRADESRWSDYKEGDKALAARASFVSSEVSRRVQPKRQGTGRLGFVLASMR